MSVTIDKEVTEFLKKSKIFFHLEQVSQIIPIPIYWLDINHRVMGANEHTVKAIGVSSVRDIIGKTAYDVYPHAIAEKLVANQKEVIDTGNTLTVEETIPNTAGAVKHYTAIIAPLFDNDHNIIGTIGASIDITQEKHTAELSKKAKVLEHLDRVARIFPTPLYWLDTNHIVIGLNDHTLKATGIACYADMIGKTAYDLYPKEIADHIIKHNEVVMQSREIHSQEEAIKDITTGEIKFFNATLAPFYDDDGHVMGVIGISIDITAEKDAARLRLESEKQKVQLKEQERFSRLASQVVHDIRSPVTSLSVLSSHSGVMLPEKERITLQRAITRIEDIANHLLSEYKVVQALASAKTEPELLLVSPTILQLLTEKKYEYQRAQINWVYTVDPSAHFAFIQIEPDAFSRMLSNLINNAVDALPHKQGDICIHVEANIAWVKIHIDDNGKGMSSEIIAKIQNNIAVTAGKGQGYGIGLTQVQDTLQKHQGEIMIHSIIDKGTDITLTFPRMEAPQWIAEKIELQPSDTIVILDDDPSIHHAWEVHFESIVKQGAKIQLQHYTFGEETLVFLNALSEEDKENIILLSDYELLKQSLNGLDVIEKSQIARSFLVTSHFDNPRILRRAEKMSVPVLPKQLVGEIPIVWNNGDKR